MSESLEALDRRVRWHVYDQTMRTGVPPLSHQIATALKLDGGAAVESLVRLGAAHILVLQPDRGEILMANPFSAVPTPFQVEVNGLSTYGNCIWAKEGAKIVAHNICCVISALYELGIESPIGPVDRVVRTLEAV